MVLQQHAWYAFVSKQLAIWYCYDSSKAGVAISRVESDVEAAQLCCKVGLGYADMHVTFIEFLYNGLVCISHNQHDCEHHVIVHCCRLTTSTLYKPPVET